MQGHREQPSAHGIEQARLLLPRCYVDADRCRPLLRALESYRKDWDEARKTFALRLRHDWASHGADAFRYLAVGLRPKPLATRPPVSIKAPVCSFTRSEAPARPRRY